MKKKLLLTAIAAFTLTLSAGIIACSPTDDADHKHEFTHVEGYAATCAAEGLRSYDECEICHYRYIDGKKVMSFEVHIPIDPQNHAALEEVPEAEGTCSTMGCIAHSYCSACGKYYINGTETTLDAVQTPIVEGNHVLQPVAETPATCYSKGRKACNECTECGKLFIGGVEQHKEDTYTDYAAHTFDEQNGLVCSVCKAYKLLYNGNYYAIDASNITHLTPDPLGLTYSASDSEKAARSAQYSANPMSISSQTGTGASATFEDGKFVMHNDNGAKSTNQFPRFAFGDENGLYTGRILVTFDCVFDASAGVERIGARLVDNTFNALKPTETTQSHHTKLIGTNKDEENNPDRTFEVGEVYTFAYVFEITSMQQYVQIFFATAASSPITVTLSNLHVIELDEEDTGVTTSDMIYFGKAADIVLQKESCTHAHKYDVEAFSANCIHIGTVAHEKCPQCGKYFVGGTEKPEDEVITERTDHEYGEKVEAKDSTCSENGNDAYYQCTVCGQYFDESQQPIDGMPLRERSAHEHAVYHAAAEATCHTLGNSQGYWYCSDCDRYFLSEAKPAAEAEAATVEEVFDRHLTEHDFGGDGVCRTAGCGVKWEDWTIQVEEGGYGKDGASINPYLAEHPGTWACQTDSGNDARVEGGVLKMSAPWKEKANKTRAFVRVIPAKDGTTYLGAFAWSFTLKFTKAYTDKSGGSTESGTVKVTAGFFIQASDVSGNFGTIADGDYDFEIGKAYRFTVYCETITDHQFVQFNLRNTAGSGFEAEISDAQIIYYPEATKTNGNIMYSVEFMADVPAAAAASAICRLPEAVLPAGKRF